MKREEKVIVSVGIFAHNEEENIVQAITSIQKQVLKRVTVKEIVVVSSGSWDKTNVLVRKLMAKDKRIKLIEQLKRQGKSAAINLYLRRTSAPITITMSADLRLSKNAIEEMGVPFLHKDVGMVGGHPIPVMQRKSGIYKEIKLLWELHHLISLIQPKCGEIVAFRNIIRKIPLESAVDEATIEVLLHLIGYQVVYAPRAIVYNRGPKTIKAFFVQRRRVQAGHQWVAEKYNYEVVTMKSPQLLRVIMQYLWKHPENITVVVRLVILEVVARFLGIVDYYLLGRNPYVWEMIER